MLTPQDIYQLANLKESSICSKSELRWYRL